MPKISESSLERLWYLRREVDRIFREFFEARRGEENASLEIPTDIFESAEELLIEAELPGVEREDLSVLAQSDYLLLEGTKSGEPVVGNGHYLVAERPHGIFRRIIELPRAVDMQRISASYAMGLLTIRVPKIAERRGQKRQIPLD